MCLNVNGFCGKSEISIFHQWNVAAVCCHLENGNLSFRAAKRARNLLSILLRTLGYNDC